MKQKGFNFIELMIVVTIIGILASVAIPAYQKNVIKSARGDGMTALLEVMRAEENFFANEFTYTTNLAELSISNSLSSAGKYKISAGACGSEALTACVRLTATAQGGQASDGNLTLDSRGNRTHGSSSSWPK